MKRYITRTIVRLGCQLFLN